LENHTTGFYRCVLARAKISAKLFTITIVSTIDSAREIK